MTCVYMYVCENLLSYEAGKTCFVCSLDPVWCEEMGHFVCSLNLLWWGSGTVLCSTPDRSWIKTKFQRQKVKAEKILYWIESKREFFNCWNLKKRGFEKLYMLNYRCQLHSLYKISPQSPEQTLISSGDFKHVCMFVWSFCCRLCWVLPRSWSDWGFSLQKR